MMRGQPPRPFLAGLTRENLELGGCFLTFMQLSRVGYDCHRSRPCPVDIGHRRGVRFLCGICVTRASKNSRKRSGASFRRFDSDWPPGAVPA